MKDLNIMIVGVGGQGSLLASKLLGSLFIDAGLDVKVSEVHGMSQRGGSVVTYVKSGKKVHSPIIDKGQADVIISFEQLEAARWLPYLKKGGILITNTQKIMPMPVVIGGTEYPSNIIETLKDSNIKLISTNALTIAKNAGNEKAVNTVLLGVTSKHSDISKEQWLNAIKKTVPAKFVDVNLKAFELGFAL